MRSLEAKALHISTAKYLLVVCHVLCASCERRAMRPFFFLIAWRIRCTTCCFGIQQEASTLKLTDHMATHAEFELRSLQAFLFTQSLPSSSFCAVSATSAATSARTPSVSSFCGFAAPRRSISLASTSCGSRSTPGFSTFSLDDSPVFFTNFRTTSNVAAGP